MPLQGAEWRLAMTECSSASRSTIRPMPDLGRRASRPHRRVDPRLLAAAALMIVIAAAEVWVVIHGAPALNALAPYYVP